ncbi:hypothetical protein T265_07059 [Opisthorchis viverrini]|uniref:Uncharacterized protein n=1 Tax=Opisthorchis viverrini TaxID=6198 RepID=A0A074ZQ79_OPIVI|nr:hypothetical protein T265_07059 [Opisthorchis viverrini]KER25490.1 hypothetical protein T265_07059 [Opisthorchis viverrini]
MIVVRKINHQPHKYLISSMTALRRRDDLVRCSNPTSVSRFSLSRLGQPDSIPSLVLHLGGMVGRLGQPGSIPALVFPSRGVTARHPKESKLFSKFPGSVVFSSLSVCRSLERYKGKKAVALLFMYSTWRNGAWTTVGGRSFHAATTQNEKKLSNKYVRSELENLLTMSPPCVCWVNGENLLAKLCSNRAQLGIRFPRRRRYSRENRSSTAGRVSWSTDCRQATVFVAARWTRSLSVMSFVRPD